jgi:pyridoxal 5'-phosphate synthase pdxT subunit
MKTVVGVLALQGAFLEHLTLLRKAADFIARLGNKKDVATLFDFTEVRTKQQLSLCDALIIPGGESTTISLVAADSGLLEPLRDFVKYDSYPVGFSWLTFLQTLSEANMGNMCWTNPARRIGQSDKEGWAGADRRPGRAGEPESLRKAD